MRRKTPIHPHRLSESTLSILNACDRLFELERLLVTAHPLVEGESPAMMRGKAFGVGVQTYILTGDMDKAIFDAWLEYYPEIENPPYISVSRTLNNLWCAQAALDTIRRDYEVAVFDGRPAIEMSFRLDIDGKWFYVGYIDLVLRHRVSGIYVVLEVKTTAYKLIDLKPVYKNSGQALGYSIILDKVAGEEQSRYGVLYLVCRDKSSASEWTPDVYVFPFTKTLVDRYNWFISLGLKVEHLNRMDEIGIFPMNGAACVRFNKVCQHFGVCGIKSADVKKEIIEDNTEYQFRYKLADIIQDHLQRLEKELSDETSLETI